MARVVISGIGSVCSLGKSYSEITQNLYKGVNGFSKISTIDYPVSDCGYACEVNEDNFDQILNSLQIHSNQIITKKYPFSFDDSRLCKYNRDDILALWCAEQAILDSGIELNSNTINRAGAYFGANLQTNDLLYLMAMSKDKELCDGDEFFQCFCKDIVNSKNDFIPTPYPFNYPMKIAEKYNLSNGFEVFMTGCSSSNNAIGTAFRKVQTGAIDYAICGGVDSPIDPIYISFFNSLGVLNKCSGDNKLCKPYAEDRLGFGVGEGGAFFILEELERAKKRNANIYAEIVGYSSNMAFEHMTDCDPEGNIYGNCLSKSLIDAQIHPEKIDYINSHGNATLIDISETKAIKKVFGKKAYDIPVSSTKPMVGHTIVGSGSLEALACIGSINDSIIHPTINLDNPDTACDLNYVPNKAISKSVNYAMSFSLAFFGYNTSIILKNINYDN